MSKEYIVELEEGVWIANIDGDPGRTILKKNAQRFASKISAEKALKNARRFRPFKNAIIHE